MLKNNCFGFTKVQWLQLTGKVDKSVSSDVKFSQDLAYQKLLKIGNFDRIIQKNKKVDVLGDTG